MQFIYAERKITAKGNLGSSSRFHKWKPTNREELLALFGLTAVHYPENQN